MPLGSLPPERHSQALAVVAGSRWALVSFCLPAHLPLFSPFPEIPRTCHLQGAAADDAAGGDPAPHATQSPLPHQVTSPSHRWGGNRCCLMPAPIQAECPVGLEPAPGRSFSLGSQTAQGLPLEPGFGVVRIPLGCSVTVSRRCFFELQKLLVCIKIKPDICSPGSLAAQKDGGNVSPSPFRGGAGFWLERHPSCSPCVTHCPAPTLETCLEARRSPLGRTSGPKGRNSFLAQGLICLLRHKSCWCRLPCWAQWCGRHLTWSLCAGCCRLPSLPAAAKEMTCCSLLQSCSLLVPPSPLQGLQQANALPCSVNGCMKALLEVWAEAPACPSEDVG